MKNYDAKILELIRKGKTINEISQELNLSVSWIYRLIKKNKWDYKKTRTKFSKEIIDYLIKCFNESDSFKEMFEKFNKKYPDLSYSRVRNLLYSRGLNFKEKQNKKIEEKKIFVYECMQNSISLKEAYNRYLSKYSDLTYSGFVNFVYKYNLNKSLNQELKREKQEAVKDEILKKYKIKYNILLKEVAFQENVLKTIKENLRSFPYILPKFQDLRKTNKEVEEEVGMMLGDLHVGEIVDESEMGGFNSYNFEIFQHRLEFYIEKVIHITKNLLKGYKFSTLNIFNMGDMISGTIHEELIETANYTVVEWVFGTASLLSQAFLELAQYFEKVKIFGVVGNHGRLDKKIKYKRRYVNWDFILYNIVGILLKNQKNIECYFPKSFFMIKEINGHNFLILHGDNIRSWMGIPWYGIERMIAKFNEILNSHSTFIKYILLGHFHDDAALRKVKGERIINGSMIGGNEYSLGRFYTTSDPVQLIFGIHKQKGITWRFPVNLSFANLKKSLRYKFDWDKEILEQIIDIF